jgi:hypothetical protein
MKAPMRIDGHLQSTRHLALIAINLAMFEACRHDRSESVCRRLVDYATRENLARDGCTKG